MDRGAGQTEKFLQQLSRPNRSISNPPQEQLT
jgi:hypothetical protein